MKDMESFIDWFYQLSDLLTLWTLTRSFINLINNNDTSMEVGYLTSSREFVDLTAHLQRMENREM